MFYINMDDGVRLAVNDYCPNYNDTIIFVHDWPESMGIFEYQFDILPTKGFRCIGYDMRGFGHSDAPAVGYCYDRLARDLYMLIRKLHPRNLTLVGFGMGGAVCVRYITRFKAYCVNRLALVSAALPCFTRRQDYPYGMTPDAAKNLMTLAYFDRPRMVEEYVSMLFNRETSRPMREWVRNICLTGSGRATIECAKALIEEDMRRELQQVNVPTAIFHGSLDRVCPLDFAILQKDSIRNSKLFEFSDCGHALILEYVEGFNERLVEYIAATAKRV